MTTYRVPSFCSRLQIFLVPPDVIGTATRTKRDGLEGSSIISERRFGVRQTVEPSQDERDCSASQA